MQRWNWFLSADVQGRWIITKGYADVEFNRPSFRASLRYSADTLPYQIVVGMLNDQGDIEATVTSPDQGVPPFLLRGPLLKILRIRALQEQLSSLTALPYSA